MSSLKDHLVNKKILILGLGLQGGGAGDAKYLHDLGLDVRITDLKSAKELSKSLKDLRDIPHTLGEHKKEDIDWADIILKNPAIPDGNQFLQHAISSGKEILMSAALLTKYSKTPIIGITGTRGKSTTTQLVYEILNAHSPGDIAIGGNLPGHSSLQLLGSSANMQFLVLELSSFQLHGFHDLTISPQYSILTNIYPDHLNRYQSMEDYMHDKQAIFQYQSPQDHLLYNSDNPLACEMIKQAPGNTHAFKDSDLPTNLSTSLPGLHNRQNIAAAYSLSLLLQIPAKTFTKVVTSFTGLPYRMQTVAVKNDITFINDTTSTTPTSTIKAVSSMNSPTILILGGESKNLPIDKMISVLSNSPHITGIVILGSKNNHKLNEKLDLLKDKTLGKVESMRDAFKLAVHNSGAGHSILLSPGYASFDLFDNEFDRGDQFNQEVNNLTSS